MLFIRAFLLVCFSSLPLTATAAVVEFEVFDSQQYLRSSIMMAKKAITTRKAREAIRSKGNTKTHIVKLTRTVGRTRASRPVKAELRLAVAPTFDRSIEVTPVASASLTVPVSAPRGNASFSLRLDDHADEPKTAMIVFSLSF